MSLYCFKLAVVRILKFIDVFISVEDTLHFKLSEYVLSILKREILWTLLESNSLSYTVFTTMDRWIFISMCPNVSTYATRIDVVNRILHFTLLSCGKYPLLEYYLVVSILHLTFYYLLSCLSIIHFTLLSCLIYPSLYLIILPYTALTLLYYLVLFIHCRTVEERFHLFC